GQDRGQAVPGEDDDRGDHLTTTIAASGAISSANSQARAGTAVSRARSACRLSRVNSKTKGGSARTSANPAPAHSASGECASRKSATATRCGRPVGEYVRIPVPISAPNRTAPQKGANATSCGTRRAFCGTEKENRPSSRASSTTAARPVSAWQTDAGSTGRTTEPTTTKASAVGTAPRKRPVMKAAVSDPRRTDEDSAHALLRLHTDPDREAPATRAASSQVKPRTSNPATCAA